MSTSHNLNAIYWIYKHFSDNCQGEPEKFLYGCGLLAPFFCCVDLKHLGSALEVAEVHETPRLGSDNQHLFRGTHALLAGGFESLTPFSLLVSCVFHRLVLLYTFKAGLYTSWSLAGLSWATYGTWIYRIELPPRAERPVRATVPRYVDLYFDPSYKLYQTHAQSISTEPRVPMFEGFTMPPLTLHPERNAMYKQIQCRPTAVDSGESGDHEAEQDAFKHFSRPKQRVPGE